MKFDSTDYLDASKGECYYGAVRAVVDEEGSGNSEVTEIEFETPAGFSQLMEVTILTGDNPRSENVYKLEDVHTIRVKITGEWEAGGITHGLADLLHAMKIKATLES